MSFLDNGGRPQNDPAPATPPPGRGSWEPTPYAAKALRDEVAYVIDSPPGTRNGRLNQAAYNMIQIVMGGGISEPQVTDALTAAGLANGRGEPREVANTIRSGYAKGAHRARSGTGSAQNGQNGVLPTLDVYTDLSTYLNWNEAYMDQKDVEWLCEPFIPAGRLVALYSPPKVGKSLLALEIAAAISRGAECLGTPTTQATVLYLDYENAVQDVVSRLKAMGRSPGELDALKYWSFPMAPALDTAAGGALVLQHAQDTGAGLVVIDTVSRCISGDENDASTWLNLYRHTLLPLKGAGVAVLRLDHTGKDEGRGMRGSSAKSGDVDLIWRLSELTKGTSYVLECESHRIEMHETLLNIERTSAPLKHRVDTRSLSQTKRDAILAALDDAGLEQSAGRDRARKVLTAAGIKVMDKTLAEILRQRQGLPPLT